MSTTVLIQMKNLPPGCNLRDIEGQQMSDDEAHERELERGDMKLDLQDGDVDKPETKGWL